MSAPTLTEFLLARIAEDEAVAREAITERDRVEFTMYGQPEVPDLTMWANPDLGVPAVVVGPERVLADCEAKRRIAERYRAIETTDDIGIAEAHLVLMYLASVYGGHPGFDEAWRA